MKLLGLTNKNSRFFKSTGEIVLESGEVAVVAQGRYMKAPLSKIADFDPEENDWRVVENEDDPKFIEL
jgi:chaperone required for assembly of F1-ATPase